MRRQFAILGIMLSLALVFAPDTLAQGRGGGRGMRGRGNNNSQGQMAQRWQAQNRYGMSGQRGRAQQGGPRGGQGGARCAVQGSAPAGQLTQRDAEGILLLREEEKLARDVYLTLGEKWNVRVFKNIAQAEARHMSVMKMLVDKYGLRDPVTDDTVGKFGSPKFARLYHELVEAGSVSLAGAYQVGVKIEQLDIRDLKEGLAGVQSTDVRRVYQNLLRASENHLRAFSSQL
jgi:hypothetical protein